MNGKTFAAIAAGFCALILASCQETEIAAKPQPVELTREAAAHYCQMIVLEHPGPKAQIHLAGNPHPIWFTQIRDAVAFAQLPEETNEIAAIYVSDMTHANWQMPSKAEWITAETAHYVIESKRLGGMGAPEAVPFSDRAAAESFRSQNGGRIVGFDEIPSEYVMAPVDVSNILKRLGG